MPEEEKSQPPPPKEDKPKPPPPKSDKPKSPPPKSSPKPPAKKPDSKNMADGYEGQNQRALIWAVIYFLGWLLQRLWCHLGIPDHCDLALKPLDVLTDLVVLFTFCLAQRITYMHGRIGGSGAFFVNRANNIFQNFLFTNLQSEHAQAYWCEILLESRWKELIKAPWIFGLILVTPIIISALGVVKGLKPWDLTNEGEDFEFSAIRSTIFVFGLIAAVLLTAWHFARAWLTLPGVQLVSGGVKCENKPEQDLHGIYASSRIVVVTWCILFTSFIIDKDDGFDYRGALLAWVLSLIAVFPHPVSYLWLGVNTGIFIQGIGANRLRFLGCPGQNY